MKRYSSFLSILTAIPLLFAVFSLAYAGSYQTKIDGIDYYAEYEGLVPCGKCIDVKTNIGDPAPLPSIQRIAIENQNQICRNISPAQQYFDCQLCHLFVMADDILDLIMWKLVPALTTLFLVFVGIRVMATQEDPMGRTRAKEMLKSIVIGVALIYGAWLIVNTILSFSGIVDPSFFEGLNPGGWFVIDCPITY